MSYHNGSVWPHDTSLIAGGLARYGFRDEATRIRAALYDLASSQSDHRLPELVAGYPQNGGPHPFLTRSRAARKRGTRRRSSIC